MVQPIAFIPVGPVFDDLGYLVEERIDSSARRIEPPRQCLQRRRRYRNAQVAEQRPEASVPCRAGAGGQHFGHETVEVAAIERVELLRQARKLRQGTALADLIEQE